RHVTVGDRAIRSDEKQQHSLLTSPLGRRVRGSLRVAQLELGKGGVRAKRRQQHQRQAQDHRVSAARHQVAEKLSWQLKAFYICGYSGGLYFSPFRQG